MAVWRCPHCSTPQAEASRCWVCHRSTTSCATCRHFRRGVASGLGTCGLDPRRAALSGTEMRACWAAPDLAPDDAPPQPRSPTALHATGEEIVGRRPRTFVPVDGPAPLPPEAPPILPAEARVVRPGAGSWSLWGDLDA